MSAADLKRIRRQAAEWLARKQAGFTQTEAKAFAVWCGADPRHGALFKEIEASWAKFDCLSFYPGAADAAPDPDFVAPRGGGWTWGLSAGVATAACLGAAFLVLRPRAHAPAHVATPAAVLATDAAGDFLHLSDGSTVELQPGAVVREEFTAAERRVRLVRGEAEFSVVHNAARPFIVEANGVAVRDIGTQFDVKLAPGAVDVLVSEGVVQVSRSEVERTVVARQRTSFPTEASMAGAPAPGVETLGDAEMDRALAWQKSRLVFDATPLSEVVAEVNLRAASRREALHLVLGDSEVGAIRVSGRVSASDLGDFVTVLQTDFGVDVERRAGGERVLTQRAR